MPSCKELSTFLDYVTCSLFAFGTIAAQEEATRVFPNSTNSNTEASSDAGASAREVYVDGFGKPTVKFEEDEQGLHVTITTDRLHICSVTEQDVDNYDRYLFGDSTVMRTYGTGEVKDREYSEKRISGWAKRWRQGNPFSGLAIWLKPRKPQHDDDKPEEEQDENMEFLGHVVLGGGDEPNSSEIAYLIRADRWRKGYATEAVGAAVLYFAREMALAKYKLPGAKQQEFERIIATTRTDNPASFMILKELGFQVYKQSNKYGHTRDHYELHVKQIAKL